MTKGKFETAVIADLCVQCFVFCARIYWGGGGALEVLVTKYTLSAVRKSEHDFYLLYFYNNLIELPYFPKV